jgi:hypothetical protein
VKQALSMTKLNFPFLSSLKLRFQNAADPEEERAVLTVAVN